MAMRLLVQVLGLLVIASLLTGVGGSSPSAQQLSPFPRIYSGSVTISGEPAPDGLEIVARIGDRVSTPRPITNGEYVGLTVNVPDGTYVGKTITFHIGEIEAEQTSIFRAVSMIGSSSSHLETLDLTFASLPITLAFDPTINATPPIIGDSSVPSVPPIAMVVGLSLLVTGIAALRLLRRREGQNSE